MEAPFHHLAQVNIAHMRAPLDAPSMSGFTSRIDEINALAESDPGFVWRWTEADNGPFDAPNILFNLSVWQSVDALQRYVYRSPHAELFRDRGQWFHPSSAPGTALWWIPAGHLPSPQEAKERLDHLAEAGPGPFAFSFRQDFDPPLAPDVVSRQRPAEAIYDGRVLTVAENSELGEVSGQTRFFFRQQGSRVWATYSGGGVRFGSLVAMADAENVLDMRYQHADDAGDLRQGISRSTPESLPDGKLQLHDVWRWTHGVEGSGTSTLEER